MSLHRIQTAPLSILAPERRGRTIGRFCRACGGTFSLHQSVHRGKGVGLSTKDHISSPCSHEGDHFVEGEEWWEPAVEVLPEAAEGEPAA